MSSSGLDATASPSRRQSCPRLGTSGDSCCGKQSSLLPCSCCRGWQRLPGIIPGGEATRSLCSRSHMPRQLCLPPSCCSVLASHGQDTKGCLGPCCQKVLRRLLRRYNQCLNCRRKSRRSNSSKQQMMA